MNEIKVCIFDSETMRSEAIKEILSGEGYQIETFSTEISSLKALLENKYDAIFIGLDFTDNIVEYLVKVRNYAPEARIVAIIAGQYPDYQFTLAELGITRYIETPIVSTGEILNAVMGIEAEVMSEEGKTSFMVSVLEQAKSLAAQNKSLSRKIGVALDMFTASSSEVNKLTGQLKDVPYYEIIRIVCSLYKEGVLEFVNEEERAVFVVKNNSVVSAYITPGVRGLKAFLRVAGWEKGHFTFKNKINISYGLEKDLYDVDVPKLCHLAKRTCDWFSKMRNNIPPKNLELKLDTRLAGRKANISVIEFDVLTTVIDHSPISEIINYNSNIDMDIFDALINLRRNGVIEVKVQ